MNIEENKETLPVIEPNTQSLDNSTKDIINSIIEEQDIDKVKDLSQLFNLNQVKKNLVRIVKLNKLLDQVHDQAIERFEQSPEEITNKELLDFMQVVQNSIDKSQKSIETLDVNPLVQVNKQEINVNVNNILDNDSKERVLDVVQKILKFAKSSKENDVVEIDKNDIEIRDEENSDVD